MAAINQNVVNFSIFLLNILFYETHSATYNIKHETPDDCVKGESIQTHQYFDVSQLSCLPCSQGSTVQTVSADGLRCVCRSGYKIIKDFGGAAIECEACPANKVTSNDGWSCISCANGVDSVTSKCNTCQVSNLDGTTTNNIAVERLLNGTYASAAPTRTCQTCTSQTAPNTDGTQCFRCNQILSVGQSDCTCPTANEVPGGICFQEPEDIVDENQQLFKVEFGSDDIESAYFAQNIQAAAGMCKDPYLNITACQELANMCALIIYTKDNVARTASEDACALYTSYSQRALGRAVEDWPPNMPWLYYSEDGEEVLTDTGIPTQFTFPNSQLTLEAAVFSLNGSYRGYQSTTGGLLQLCPDSETILNAAFKFGTFYEQTCQVTTKSLWDEEKYPLEFFDLYLSYDDNGESNMYAVPILITNYQDGNTFVNQDDDRTQWQLVRRLFLVDNISGKRSVSDSVRELEEIHPIRYAKHITLHVEMQPGKSQIYPPYLEVTYAVATSSDYEQGNKTELTFKVNYRMNMDDHNQDIGIAIGVLGALAVAYSGLQVWGWTRRSGRVGIDFIVLCKFIIFCMGNLANVFFVVMLGSSLWWIIFYKRQSTVSMVIPNRDQEQRFVSFLASAFVLKFLQLVHIIVCQVTVDIFFIDWERPRGKVISSNDAQQKGKESPVSIWRTYFAANEWNEIQTTRKINHMLQIFLVVLFLEVFGFGNLATADPYSNFKRSGDEYYSPDSRIFRFAIAGMTYLVIAVIQWVFYTFIYERFIEDKVRQYVDLCSMSNISVFILETGQYGHYIHGRSVHGRADTGMRDMAENLKREEENLCGQRGLVPNTEQQTFQIAVPLKLRTQYDKVLLPIYAEQAAPGARTQPVSGGDGGGHIDAHTDNCLKAYDILNRFLQAFIDHSLRDIDYVVKDKSFVENVLGMEFMDPLEESYFYNDSGHAFDSVLLFGHENTLIIFEILFFAIIDLASGSYILAAVMVYILMELVRAFRDGLGRSNLAKKTLVDKRFLI